MGAKRKRKGKGGKAFLTVLTFGFLITVSVLCFFGYKKLGLKGLSFTVTENNYSEAEHIISETESVISEAEHEPQTAAAKETYSFPTDNVSDTPIIQPANKTKLLDARNIYQRDKWPTGCESVSAVMALNYAGIDISVNDFIDNYLEKTATPFNPNLSFGGSPYDSGGWGCYSPVIKNALDKLLESTNRSAELLSGVPVETLCARYIDNGTPVIFWATINMAKPTLSPDKWTFEGKTIDYWVIPEHCLLLVGYDENNYIFCDPWKNNDYTYYPKEKTITAYKGLYSQAIVIK